MLQAKQITEQAKSWRSNAESSRCNVTCCSNLLERDRRHIYLLYCTMPQAVNCLTWLPVRQIQTFQNCGYFSGNGWTKVTDSKVWNIWRSVAYISAWFEESTRIIRNPKKIGMSILSWCYVSVHLWYLSWPVVLVLTLSWHQEFIKKNLSHIHISCQILMSFSVDYRVAGCDALQPVTNLPAFRKNGLPPFLG